MVEFKFSQKAQILWLDRFSSLLRGQKPRELKNKRQTDSVQRDCEHSCWQRDGFHHKNLLNGRLFMKEPHLKLRGVNKHWVNVTKWLKRSWSLWELLRLKTNFKMMWHKQSDYWKISECSFSYWLETRERLQLTSPELVEWLEKIQKCWEFQNTMRQRKTNSIRNGLVFKQRLLATLCTH